MTEKFTFFWAEVPFSQWCESWFEIDGIEYNTSEQWMMAGKARLFNDQVILEEIMNTTSPKQQKVLGRKVNNFNSGIWTKVCEEVVYQGNHAKFTQNPNMRDTLFNTAGTTLVEASPYDKVWGIGMDANDPDRFDRSKWKGLNLLGKVLTKLREDLINGPEQLTLEEP